MFTDRWPPILQSFEVGYRQPTALWVTRRRWSAPMASSRERTDRRGLDHNAYSVDAKLRRQR